MIAAKLQRTRTNATPAEPRLRRIAFYTRISTDEDHQKYSLDAQKDRLEAFCTSQYGEEWALHKLYRDTESGTHMNRPGLEEMLKDASQRGFDILLVFRVDRFSRKVRELALMVDELTKNGIAFKSITEPFDTSSAAGKMMLQMLGVFAEFEHATIVERTKVGMQKKAKNGQWVGGSVPFGFSLKDGQLVPREDEAETVKRIFALYVELGSLIGVVEELNKLGARSRHGRQFDKHTLRLMLSNPVYTGKIRYGGEIFDGAHEAIIDGATWQSVQRQLRARIGTREVRPTRSGALLSGLARCTCGASMTVQSTRKGSRKYLYYACASYQKRGANSCPGSRVATRDLEAFVVEKVREIGRDPSLVARTLKAARTQLEAKRPEIEVALKGLEQERHRQEQERQNLVTAVGKGKASPAILQRLGELDLALEANEVGLANLRADLAGIESQVIDEQDLRTALASFTPVWDQLFPREKARILSLLIDRVVYNAAAGEVEITFRPGGVKILAASNREESA